MTRRLTTCFVVAAAILTRSARIDRRGRIKLKVRCTAGPCQGRLTLTTTRKAAGKKARTIKLGAAKLTLAAGRTKTITIRLNAAGRTLLSRPTKVSASIQLGPRTNRAGASSRTVKVAPPAPPKAARRASAAG